MSGSRYGVLVGTVRQGREDPAGSRSPHFEIWVEAGPDSPAAASTDFRAAVNVRSSDGSNLLVYTADDFADPTKCHLPSLAAGPRGFQPLSTGPGGDGLDYVRDGLFPLAAMVPEPATGGASSLADLFAGVVARAASDPAAVVLVFGDFFADAGADATFGFSPEQGIHDVHMMQGSTGRYAAENTPNGDGALFVRFGDGTTFAFFARFDTQATATDPATGDPIG